MNEWSHCVYLSIRSDSLRNSLWHGDEHAGSSLVGAVRIDACERRKRSRLARRKSWLWRKSWDKVPSHQLRKRGWRSSVGSTSGVETVPNWLKSSQKSLSSISRILQAFFIWRKLTRGRLVGSCIVLQLFSGSQMRLISFLQYSFCDSPVSSSASGSYFGYWEDWTRPFRLRCLNPGPHVVLRLRFAIAHLLSKLSKRAFKMCKWTLRLPNTSLLPRLWLLLISG